MEERQVNTTVEATIKFRDHAQVSISSGPGTIMPGRGGALPARTSTPEIQVPSAMK